MIETNRILKYVNLRDNRIVADGLTLFNKPNCSPRDFFNAAYQTLQINYPRFFKMDNLCKTGFLAAELLLRHSMLSDNYEAKETGILLSTANSSLDTDMLYQASTRSAPSPSLFVYTLPNILIGEICIRNNIKGESACFVFDTFNAGFQSDYLNSLLDSHRIKTGISGWADFYNDKFEAFFTLVAKSADESLDINTAQNIKKIYHS